MIRHKFTHPDPDVAAFPGLTPSRWNDDHAFVPWHLPIIGTSVTWTNMPAAATEFTGAPRIKVDLTNADEVRIMARIGVAALAGATLRLQWAATDGGAFADLTGTVSASAVATVVSAWAAIPSGAKADVIVRILGAGGNATLDPQFRQIALQVR